MSSNLVNNNLYPEKHCETFLQTHMKKLIILIVLGNIIQIERVYLNVGTYIFT